ncbi:MAG: hypothetical protein KY455_08145 [Euryarchaeota archaeon]|nr:hypothetical protein [Euryarchaeota archaeon]
MMAYLVEALIATVSLAAASALVTLLWGVGARTERAFARVADTSGWDYRHKATETATSPCVPSGWRAGRSVTGPTQNGTFRLTEHIGTGRHPSRGVHLQMPTQRSSPGVRLRPETRFRRHRHAPAPEDHDATFAARYRIDGDQAFAPHVLSPAARTLLLKPATSIHLDWNGNTLDIWFPVTLSPTSAATLLAYGTALARCLDTDGRPRRARRIALPDAHPLGGPHATAA